MTGVSAPYEPPLQPDLHLDTATQPIERCTDCLIDAVLSRLAGWPDDMR
ncbi:MAG: hypothetical protein K6T63_07525 [Alicyclobacillus herbarius]|nr:hypothetical protein [Alicyclobacillus herbarius]